MTEEPDLVDTPEEHELVPAEPEPKAAQKPERFEIIELMELVQVEAMQRELTYARRVRSGWWKQSDDAERTIRMWFAAARVLEYASLDEIGFRDFCRSLAKPKRGAR